MSNYRKMLKLRKMSMKNSRRKKRKIKGFFLMFFNHKIVLKIKWEIIIIFKIVLVIIINNLI